MQTKAAGLLPPPLSCPQRSFIQLREKSSPDSLSHADRVLAVEVREPAFGVYRSLLKRSFPMGFPGT